MDIKELHMNGQLLEKNGTNDNSGILLLSEYVSSIKDTDVIDSDEITPILQGLYGEVGGIMAAVKKLTRDKESFLGYRKIAIEEFGDTLWYLTALCCRIDISLEELFLDAAKTEDTKIVGAASDLVTGGVVQVHMSSNGSSFDQRLFELGKAAANLMCESPSKDNLLHFVNIYLQALYAAKLPFAEVARYNINKVRGAFLEPVLDELIDFDADYNEEEKLPQEMKILITQRGSGRSYLQWNGVFIGDPLSDNISSADGYRFHDIFHLAYVAVLHWSPVIRALIKHKRKSNPECDEAQDSGRPIVIEEGLTAWIFSKAKEMNYFEGVERIPLDMLKTIADFVRGYEVEKCPLKLWEKAILEGYAVFREVRKNNGGWVLVDRKNRKISYQNYE